MRSLPRPSEERCWRSDARPSLLRRGYRDQSIRKRRFEITPPESGTVASGPRTNICSTRKEKPGKGAKIGGDGWQQRNRVDRGYLEPRDGL